MSCYINDIPLSNYGFQAGWITTGNRPDSSYALSGIWSVPKRIGKTYHDWGGDIEPYVDKDDLVFDYQTFTLSIATKADSREAFRERLMVLYKALGSGFDLSDTTLGDKKVIFLQSQGESYGNGWGMVTLKLRDSTRFTADSFIDLPSITTPSRYGIDGYSWQELGFVVESIEGGYDMPQWQPLKVTDTDSYIGYRQPRMITISGTIKGRDYREFNQNCTLIRSVICRAGMRTIKYFDGSVYTAFCVDGLTIDGVQRFPSGEHWGQFRCKMIVL